MKLFIALLFIGISLQSFYFYQFGSPLFSLISLLILSLIVIKDLKLNINNSNYVFIFYILILLFSFLSLFYFDEHLVLTKILGFFIVFLACFTSNILYKSYDILYLIRIYLKIHVFFFYLQFFAYYLFKIHLDFLYPITGEEQRVFGGNFELPYLNAFMRPSGLFNEPGTYVTFVAPIVVLFGKWSNNFTKNDLKLYIFSFITLFLSFSVFGIIFGLLILFFASILKKKYRVIIGGVIMFFLIIPYLTYRFFMADVNINNDSGLGLREVFLNESYKFITSDFGAFIFGSGHLSSDAKANFISSYNDIGLIPYLLHFSGPILTFVLLVILIRCMLFLDRFAILGILILFISKMSILSPFFPILLTLLLSTKIEKDIKQ
jgi:hypothetical protein